LGVVLRGSVWAAAAGRWPACAAARHAAPGNSHCGIADQRGGSVGRIARGGSAQCARGILVVRFVGGSSFASDTEAPVSAHAPATTAPRYVESPLFDEFDAAEDNEDLVFGNSGPVLESPLPGELSAPLTLPSFVEDYLKAEMEDDDQFEDFNEDDFDEEFDDDFEEEEDDFDYGEQELEEGVQESDDSGGDLGPDAVPDGDFED